MKANVDTTIRKFKISLWVRVSDASPASTFKVEPNHEEYYWATSAGDVFYNCGIFTGSWKTWEESKDHLIITQSDDHDRWLLVGLIEHEEQ